MNGPPPYLIVHVLQTIRLPLKVSPVDGRLVHAVPKDTFDQFATVEEAQEAVNQATAKHPSELIMVYEVISVAGWEEANRPRSRRQQKGKVPDER